MKKLFSFALVLLLAVSLLGGCGKAEPESLAGVWKGELDMTEAFKSQMDEDLRDMELEKIAVTVVYTFTEDGVYTVRYDEASLEQTTEGVLKAMRAYLEASLVKKAEEAGMTVDEMMGILGMTAEEFADTMMDAFEEQDLFGELLSNAKTQGRYRAGDGRLYRSDSVDTQPDETVYETYTLEGDVLTITGRLGESADEETQPATVYPIILKKSAEPTTPN